jgi:hypothetical protein
MMHGAGTQFREDMIDDLNISLFDVSENKLLNYHNFYEAVANICTSAGIGIKDASLMMGTLPPDSYENWFTVGSVIDKKGFPRELILYIAYTRDPSDGSFSSHAELMTREELDELLSMGVANEP